MSNIKKNVSKLLAIYKNLRHNKTLEYKFWDVVVLTALDETQKRAYELQIEEKLHEEELPSKVKYVVIADPQGSCLGCGGATMHAVYQLNYIYGEDLFNKYILLINTGGHSKRLPSASILGKIFMALPYEDKLWTLLDLKLALYLPFIQKMTPGIFQTSSDTIELFHLDWEPSENVHEETGWDFCHPGLTALAHPSSLQIGCMHGVFVVEETDQQRHQQTTVEFLKCSEVLQKPSLEQMALKKAVLKNKKENGETESFVYIDSSYFFNHQISREFIKFFQKHQPLRCEVNGYENFMKILNNPKQFIQESTVDAMMSKSLLQTRVDLADALKDFNLNVLALNHSEFFHLGTMQEYLDHFNPHGHLSDLIQWKNVVLTTSKNPLNIHKTSVSIHNFFLLNSNISRGVVVEYCHFNCPINIDQNCIMSNCHVEKDQPINIPSNTFIHTVPVKMPSKENSNENIKYVTLIFNLQDDLKKSYDSLESFSQIHSLENSSLNSSDAQFNEIVFQDGVFSLWNARLFACMDNMADSFLESIKMLTSKRAGINLPFKNHLQYLSAAEVMSNRDIHDILSYRTRLRTLINASNITT